MSVQFHETARNTDSANAGQVGCDGENIGEIHVQRISDTFANLERYYRRGWGDQRVDFFESARKIPPNQFADFLRAQIIRIVITGAQNVSAKNDPAFHFGPETLLSRAAVK